MGYFGNVVELLACWKGHLGRYQYLVIWWLVPHCLMWCLKGRGTLAALRAVKELFQR